MAEYLTILGRRRDYKAAYDAICGTARGTFQVQGDPDCWESIRVSAPSGKIRFISVEFTGGDDEFCKTKDAIRGKFATIDTKWVQLKKTVLDAIEHCQLIIEVAADPICSLEDGHDDAVSEVAKHLDGIIFSIDAMMDPEGWVILDLVGDSYYENPS